MALINGNDYDHIDFTKNGVTTRHMLKDTLSRQMSGDLVKVQNEEPTSEGTKIWIKPSGDSEVQVPTYEEFEALSDRVDSINTMSIHICTAQEYNSETGVPTVSNPDAKTFYLVPGGDAPNLYVEWIFTDSRWEQFGSATIDLSNYATKDEIPEVPVQDVQIAGVSVLQDGVANVPLAGANKVGVVMIRNADVDGLVIDANGTIHTYPATSANVKMANNGFRPLVSTFIDSVSFFGLAKASGDTTQAASSNAVGQYTDEAKEAIAKMLGLHLWHEAYLDVNDYDSTLGMFILDVGEGSEVKDIRVNGQVVWDTAIVANSYLGVGVGNTTNRNLYSDFAQYKIPVSANRISVAADGHMIDPIGDYRCCMGYGYFGFSNNTGHVLNVDIECKAQMTCSQTCVYHAFNDPRYVHVVAPDNPSWALIKVEYTLK